MRGKWTTCFLDCQGSALIASYNSFHYKKKKLKQKQQNDVVSLLLFLTNVYIKWKWLIVFMRAAVCFACQIYRLLYEFSILCYIKLFRFEFFCCCFSPSIELYFSKLSLAQCSVTVIWQCSGTTGNIECKVGATKKKYKKKRDDFLTLVTDCEITNKTKTFYWINIERNSVGLL